ncbi:hypothetical protein HPB51_029637 [Rhipicephalus microplus]|uniref:Tick transposon n=1 Tax=Rhipicephalus microplus TaxID=6941 RepID=A0A9J6CUD0_RHIMP|nr:hypothetical protein HPB51_029637 [Rhipicephalus microplus]
MALTAALAGWPGVVVVRVNHRRNIVAADTASPERLHELLTITELNGMPVTTREPADSRVSTGFVYGVDGDLTNAELLRGIASAAPVTAATREGGTVKLHFASPSPPDHITISGQPPRVRPCTGDCIRCGRRHPKADFSEPHCVNCGGAHLATNPTCPTWQDERRVATLMATTLTLLSRHAARAAVHEERREVRSYAAELKASPPPSSKAPGQSRTPPVPRQLN